MQNIIQGSWRKSYRIGYNARVGGSKVSSTQVSGILFADVVGSSSGKDDRQIVEVQRYLQEFVDKHVSEETCLYKNTWGDGVVLACADPNDALEYALRLRAWFKIRNWRRVGFAQPLEVRIGLHADRVHLERGIFTSRHLMNAARPARFS